MAKKSPAKATTKKKQPAILSGGNPQIAKGDGPAPVKAYIAAIPDPWKKDIVRTLDALITETIPGCRKAVRWNTPFYGAPLGQGDETWFLSMHCVTKYIKVGFFSGASLDPMPPVESKMKNVRYLHIHQGDWGKKVDPAQVASWIRQAARLPGFDCF